MGNFISYEQSLELINNLEFKKPMKKKVFILNALGKVLANDIIAKENNPMFPTSAMDGYAIKYEDINEQSLKIIAKNPAGEVIDKTLQKGDCIKTFTGSLMPKGSDTLIPIENVEVKDDEIFVKEKVFKGFALRQIGENYKKDEVLIKKGSIISFAQIGVLASLNISQIYIYESPKIAILSTGSEILDLGEEQSNASQIRSSNHLTIQALCQSVGANTLQLGIVKDDKKNITKFLKEGLQSCDIVVTTGGVSVGDYDFVKDVIKDELKAQVLFHGLAIKPGMHLLIAKKDEKIIIALPGFAYSASVCAILYLVPLIYKLKASNESLKKVKAIIDEDFSIKVPKTVFTACNVEYKQDNYHINFKDKKQGTSAILTNLLNSPALLIQDEKTKNLKAGDIADIILLDYLK